MIAPHEMHIGEVFMPPMLVAGILGLITASLSAKILNKYHLSKHFFFPPLVFVALMVIYTVVFGLIIIPF